MSNRAHFSRASAWSLAALIAQPVAFFLPVLVLGKKSIPYDLETFHLPLIAYVARCARERTMPLWDPFPYCGVPIHADLQAQIFYPFTWLSIALGNLSSGHALFYWIEWQIPLHMILSGLFTFWLLKHIGLAPAAALFGATVYQLSGYFASQAQHLGAVCCAAWLPLILLCLWRLSEQVTARWSALLALGIALAILSGFVAAASVVFGAAAMLALARLLAIRRDRTKFLAAILCGVILGAGLSAIQMLPTLQLTRLSVASERPQAVNPGGGLPIESLVSFFAPNYYRVFSPFDPSKFQLHANFTFLYVYCGIATAILLLMSPFLKRAPHARLFALLAAVSALWMLGGQNPLYLPLVVHLPPWVRGALYPEFALMAFCLFAALAAAVALNRISPSGWIPWAVVLVTFLDLYHFSAIRPMNTGPGGYLLHDSESSIGAYPGLLPAIRNLLAAAKPPLRIDYTERDLLPGIRAAGMLGLPTPDGDNPFALKRLLAVRRIFSSGNWWDRQLPVDRPGSPILGMLNVGFLAAHPGGPVALDRLPVALDRNDLRFYRLQNALPRFYLVGQIHRAGDLNRALAYLARPDFDPAREAVVETPGSSIDGPFAGGSVQVVSYSANRVELQVLTTGRAFLASSEVLYPGWRVAVNGRARPFYMTNAAFRGVLLDAGASRLVMTYAPDLLIRGAVVSLFSALPILAALLWPWPQPSRSARMGSMREARRDGT